MMTGSEREVARYQPASLGINISRDWAKTLRAQESGDNTASESTMVLAHW